MAEPAPQEADCPTDFVSNLVARYSERYPWMDNLATEFFLRFAATASARTTATVRFFKSRGLHRTTGRYGVLRVLYFAPQNTMALSDISNDMDVTPANITVLVDGLAKDGFVTRIPHPTDKRSTWVQLTRQGGELCSQIVPGMASLNDQLLKGFSDDEKLMLIDAMKRIRQNAEQSFSAK